MKHTISKKPSFRIVAIVLSVSLLAIASVFSFRTRQGATLGFEAPLAYATGISYFLKIDGIGGESKDAQHMDQIDIMSWDWGFSRTPQEKGKGGAGKVETKDFTFTKRVDKASPQFLIYCASGKHIKDATLTAHKAGASADYLAYTFHDIMCTSFGAGGSNSEPPSEHISFSYGKVEVEYKEQKTDGTFREPLKSAWDFVKNISF